ncbi:3-carboxy-cis,cis-muconate cycloisomerase, partial [Escherichia coli]
MSQLYASLFYPKDVTDIFSDSSLVTYMIQVEVALAQAQAQVGVIPQNAANTIAQVAEHAL